ncbi:FMRF-Like Peptide [Caenorhabditis elegans]|uniref:FMRF-Like Peptide n=1 Tax=Caenorhabditis elegans TaxID=6239 RepID=A0A168HBI5_CAEEL|nr:FMRF-Like Peptide [Caenorhabditis elegans]SAP35617.1 FMRF-Like Peptide [Caenorhabditis elegans]|eukprot:NP_001317855.1 Uncharacterized protein CELE_Y47D7A.19 [Caenorhabditis elegans]
MRTFIIFSALLVILVQCGYPTSYPVAPSFAPRGIVPRSLPEQPPSRFTDWTVTTDSESDNSEFRKRAKARTARNRKF